MCGIVGVLGSRDAAPVLMTALKRLEYRGYDSAGIATVHNGRLDRRRASGNLERLSRQLEREPIHGHSGIGHTRWATHGAPTIENAHPHCSGRVAVVHNGIIENHRELRDELEEHGHRFETDTDTEAVVHLCGSKIDEGCRPVEAALRTVERLSGSYALCFLFEGEDDLMVAVRYRSPLAIGHGAGEMFVGSDALALSPMTDKVTYLEDGDCAVVTRAGARILDSARRTATRPVTVIPQETELIGKGSFRHFMMKEIHDQPAALVRSFTQFNSAFRTHVDAVGAHSEERFLAARAAAAASESPSVSTAPAEVIDYAGFDRLVLCACGTAYYACQVARYWFEGLAGLPVDIDIASEFRYREPPLSERSAAIFVSQSGETADTLAAFDYARAHVAQTIAVVNKSESTLAREADVTLPILAGPEVSVASTKAFTSQLAALLWQALMAGHQRGVLQDDAVEELVTALRTLPVLVNNTIGLKPELLRIAQEIAKAKGVLYLGRGALYPIALEGALKLKEITYMHAEGHASGELKHGPIALVDETLPVIVIAPTDPLFEKTVSNMNEVMARGGRVLLITDADGARKAGERCWKSLVLPKVHPELAPILYAIPVQLLAYLAAATKGTDVDQPRNLAKSVTVE
ncbi:MAG: glutamine--fructose-6-phosphate transaminase (isomerizing) [Paracoccaceae bacterium]|nr:glutamine--fructose-6-phosphate transaminase (isomerizing) [Paracoccaceae bacterium]